MLRGAPCQRHARQHGVYSERSRKRTGISDPDVFDVVQLAAGTSHAGHWISTHASASHLMSTVQRQLGPAARRTRDAVCERREVLATAPRAELIPSHAEYAFGAGALVQPR